MSWDLTAFKLWKICMETCVRGPQWPQDNFQVHYYAGIIVSTASVWWPACVQVTFCNQMVHARLSAGHHMPEGLWKTLDHNTCSNYCMCPWGEFLKVDLKSIEQEWLHFHVIWNCTFPLIFFPPPSSLSPPSPLQPVVKYVKDIPLLNKLIPDSLLQSTG